MQASGPERCWCDRLSRCDDMSHAWRCRQGAFWNAPFCRALTVKLSKSELTLLYSEEDIGNSALMGPQMPSATVKHSNMCIRIEERQVEAGCPHTAIAAREVSTTLQHHCTMSLKALSFAA